MKINYLIGDATKPIKKPTLIVHCVNSVGKWASGFVLALDKISPYPKQEYTKWFKDVCFYTKDNSCVPDSMEGEIEVPFMLGEIQLVQVGYNYVVNAICQKDIGQGYKDMPPVRYEALREALLRTVDAAKTLNIDTISGPRFCSDRAGGDWNKIESIIKEVVLTQGINVDIYDLQPKTTYHDSVSYSMKNCIDIARANQIMKDKGL